MAETTTNGKVFKTQYPLESNHEGFEYARQEYLKRHHIQLEDTSDLKKVSKTPEAKRVDNKWCFQFPDDIHDKMMELFSPYIKPNI